MSFLRSQKGYNDVVKKYKGGKRLGGLFGKKKKPQPAPVAPAKAAESKGFFFFCLDYIRFGCFFLKKTIVFVFFLFSC